MKIDFTALEAFYAFLDGRLRLEEALAHPAYRAIFAHARRYGDGLTQAAVEQALAGQPSAFYGLERLGENLGRIREVEAALRARRQAWEEAAEAEIGRLLPGEDLAGITVYPVLGYDLGIGLEGVVCQNLNAGAYLRRPEEFLYYTIHEAAHVLYERSHPIPALREVTTPAQWRAYFALWVQNEGFAVYAPLGLRTRRGQASDPDYQVLLDPPALEASLEKYCRARRRLQSPVPLPPEEYMELTFGDDRLTYRAGCEIFRRVERQAGLEAVRRAFYMPGEAFLGEFEGPLERET